jgi:hypothetical protein
MGDAGDVARLFRSMHSAMRQRGDDGSCTIIWTDLLPKLSVFFMPPCPSGKSLLVSSKLRSLEWADLDAFWTLETNCPLLSHFPIRNGTMTGAFIVGPCLGARTVS